MSNAYDPANPPTQLVEAKEKELSRLQRERSAVREAISNVCETMVGERGSKLLELLARIEEEDGPAAAFDRMVKLLEFSMPKLQRVTVSDPDGQAPKAPIINVTFNGAAPTMKVEPITVVDVAPVEDEA